MPVAFGRAHADVTLTENGAVATKSAEGHNARTAASAVVMRSGCHFVQFKLLRSSAMLGVVRPGWDVEEGGARMMWAATASTTRSTATAIPAAASGGRRCSKAEITRRGKATASACCST